MARAPDFELYMFQLLFPLPIFFLTDPLLWFLHEVWNICFWQSVELEGRLKSNSRFLISSAYYDIRCSWSVVDHHAADKENEADLARSSHWFLHLGKDILLIFCSSLCDTCNCQSLWQGRHLLVPSCIHFTIWIHGCRWLLSHILWQMLWRMRGGRAGRAGAG